MIWTKRFWKGAGERALKTFAQAFGGVITVMVGAEAIGVSAKIGSLDWGTALSVASFATIYSLITSVGNAEFTAGTPQFLPTSSEHIDPIRPVDR